MAYPESSAKAIFEDLCRQQGKQVDQAVINCALLDIDAPIIFRRIQQTSCAGFLAMFTWHRAEYIADKIRKHAYTLKPLDPPGCFSSVPVVSHILKIERLPMTTEKEELLKIAPFAIADQQMEEDINFLITVSTLTDQSPFEELAYVHESFEMPIQSLIEAAGAGSSLSNTFVNTDLLSFFGRKTSGYIKI